MNEELLLRRFTEQVMRTLPSHQPRELHGFYNAYHRWMVRGSRDGKPFYNRIRLCGNLEAYIKNSPFARSSDIRVIQDNMAHQFDRTGLDHCYPFEKGSWGIGESFERRYHRTTNPLRVRWVDIYKNVPVVGS